MTGYNYTKNVINPALESYGLKSIPPQMTYQYLAKGYIPFVDFEGQRLVDVAEAETWLNRYLEKRVAKAEKAAS
jgi:hypothetical protein